METCQVWPGRCELLWRAIRAIIGAYATVVRVRHHHEEVKLMTEFTIDEGAPIRVQLAPVAGARQVALSPADLLQKSGQALDSAMDTIHHMARRTKAALDALPEQPSEVEISFGLTLNAAGDAVIAKIGGETTMEVTLTWEQKDEKDA
jgi:hypothetical protein